MPLLDIPEVLKEQYRTLLTALRDSPDDLIPFPIDLIYTSTSLTGNPTVEKRKGRKTFVWSIIASLNDADNNSDTDILGEGNSTFDNLLKQSLPDPDNGLEEGPAKAAARSLYEFVLNNKDILKNRTSRMRNILRLLITDEDITYVPYVPPVVGGATRSRRIKRGRKKGGCGCMIPQTGGYRATKKDKKYLNLYKKGKSIGFTMTASLKAKGLIPRANGTRRVSKKYRR